MGKGRNIRSEIFASFKRVENLTARQPPTFNISAFIFLRLLGLIYFIAFYSFLTQARGLIGENGILPQGIFLHRLFDSLGSNSFRWVPTLFWFNQSDFCLMAVCGLGALLGLALAVFGFCPFVITLLLWVFYLSLVNVGQVFLTFQWDILLLEAGFLGILLAPLTLQMKDCKRFRPPPIVIFLVFCLLFRLMFSSGAVKSLSGDPSWRNLTALTYHYETQPLPNPLSWYMQQLPAGFQKLSTAFMFAIELIAPFFIFAGRHLRRLAVFSLLMLQLLIALTGNYTFFNLLAGALCLFGIDDDLWKKIGATLKLKFRPPPIPPTNYRTLPLGFLIPLGLFIFGLSAVQIIRTFDRGSLEESSLAMIEQAASPFYLVNHYGLFAVMTTSRPEIILEGSRDGHTWLPYEFKYKPDRLSKRPPFIAPLQPRLDWQMWFAALDSYRANPWTLFLVKSLLENRPAVLGLLGKNPFPDKPPHLVRAMQYNYHFTNVAERRVTGNWWRRDQERVYLPPLSAGDFAAKK